MFSVVGCCCFQLHFHFIICALIAMCFLPHDREINFPCCWFWYSVEFRYGNERKRRRPKTCTTQQTETFRNSQWNQPKKREKNEILCCFIFHREKAKSTRTLGIQWLTQIRVEKLEQRGSEEEKKSKKEEKDENIRKTSQLFLFKVIFCWWSSISFFPFSFSVVLAGDFLAPLKC